MDVVPSTVKFSEKAKNYTSCCESNQRYAVTKGINCLHSYIEVDLIIVLIVIISTSTKDVRKNI